VGLDQHPALMPLTEDIGLASLALSVETVELLLEPVLGRLATAAGVSAVLAPAAVVAIGAGVAGGLLIAIAGDELRGTFSAATSVIPPSRLLRSGNPALEGLLDEASGALFGVTLPRGC